MAQENIQETEGTESTVDAETSAESADKEDLKPDQEEEKEEDAEVESQEEGKTQDGSDTQEEYLWHCVKSMRFWKNRRIMR